MFIEYNPNPKLNHVGDCVIRALTRVRESTWDNTYLELMQVGFELKDLPSANNVWGTYLLRNGFRRFNLPDNCPECYTVKDFCKDNRKGVFVLATGSHVIAVVNGDYYDSWDSGLEIPVYIFERI